MRTARACLAAALVLLAAAGCGAQFGGMGGMGGGKPDLPPAVRSDVPFIKCDACQRFVKQAARETRELRDKAGAKRVRARRLRTGRRRPSTAHARARAALPGCRRPTHNTHTLTHTCTHTNIHNTQITPPPQLAEADIIEKLEQLCSPQRPEGEWMRMLDMVEARDRIELREMGQVRRLRLEGWRVQGGLRWAGRRMEAGGRTDLRETGQVKLCCLAVWRARNSGSGGGPAGAKGALCRVRACSP